MKATAEAKELLKSAAKIAENENNASIGANAIWFAFAKTQNGKNVLEAFDVDVDDFRSTLEDSIILSNTGSLVPNIDISSDVERGLNLLSTIKNRLITVYDVVKFVLHCAPDDLISKFVRESKKDLDELENILDNFQLNDSALEGTISIGGVKKKREFYEDNLEDFMDKAAKEDTISGRDNEIEQLMDILCRKKKSNALLIGEPGVGKTALITGLAKKILYGDCPDSLKNKRIMGFDITSLMSGTGIMGSLEQKISGIIEGCEKDGDIILFIDEIHMVKCDYLHANDIANMLKKSMVGSKIKFIGATTYDEYRKYLSKDKAFCRRFRTVDVNEPSKEATFEILSNLRDSYESHFKVTYSDDVLNKIISLSDRYMKETYFPDKAIDLMDEAGVLASKRNDHIVTLDDIATCVSKACNVPVDNVKSSEREKLKSLTNTITKVVFGQDEAIKATVNQLKVNRTGLADTEKPIGSILYVGPTGVGKTETVKQIAKAMDYNFMRFDMSEYSDRTTINKLIGSAPGFVGYEDGALLADGIKKHPFSIVLFDEIEKADPTIYNLLLGIFDYGFFTDNLGRKIDCRNCLFIMTSNAGARDMYKKNLGFTGDSVIFDESACMEGIKTTFTPEFIARLTQIAVFNPLSDDMVQSIIKKNLDELKETFFNKTGKTLEYAEDVIPYIMGKINKQQGARDIVRVIGNLKPMLADIILEADETTDPIIVSAANLTE